MNSSKVSIIIPVYKVEAYLDRCVESVVNQTYENLEIILVDDGSPDSCPQMCDKWAEKDNRIKVIHKENGGLSDARNKGVDASTGDWIYFLDSDDYIEKNAIEKMMSAAVENSADMAVSMYYEIKKGMITEYHCSDSVEIMSPEEYMIKLYETDLAEKDYFLLVALVISCNKLIKRKCFGSLRFPEGKLHEDEFTTYKLCFACDKIVFIDTRFYYYEQRDESIVYNRNKKENFVYLDALCERLEYFEKGRHEELITLAKVHLLAAYMKHIFVARFELKDSALAEDLKKKYNALYDEIVSSDVKTNIYFVKHKSLFSSFRISVAAYFFVKSIRKMKRMIFK